MKLGVGGRGGGIHLFPSRSKVVAFWNCSSFWKTRWASSYFRRHCKIRYSYSFLFYFINALRSQWCLFSPVRHTYEEFDYSSVLGSSMSNQIAWFVSDPGMPLYRKETRLSRSTLRLPLRITVNRVCISNHGTKNIKTQKNRTYQTNLSIPCINMIK